MKMHNPPHPPDVFWPTFLKAAASPLMAAHLGIPRAKLTRVLKGEADINAELALRLGEGISQSGR